MTLFNKLGTAALTKVDTANKAAAENK
jgi:hypothetical protein